MAEPTANPEPTPSEPTANSPSGEPAAPASPSAPPERPEGLPDRYWDAERGLKVSEAAAALKDLEAHNQGQAETFKDFPEDASKAGEFYTLPENLLPEGVELPEGVKIEPNTAMLEKALPVLHKHKITREAFGELAQAFTAQQVAEFQANTEADAAENKKLGENATALRNDVASRVRARAGDKAIADLDDFVNRAPADVVKMLDAITSDGNVTPINPNRDTPPPEPVSIEERWYGPKAQKAS